VACPCDHLRPGDIERFGTGDGADRFPRDRPVRIGRFRSLSRRVIVWSDRATELYWLGIAATAAYSVGDVVSTIAFLRYVPAVKEGNPVVVLARRVRARRPRRAEDRRLSRDAPDQRLRPREGDRLLYYFPPVLLTVVGTYLTASNVRLMWPA